MKRALVGLLALWTWSARADDLTFEQPDMVALVLRSATGDHVEPACRGLFARQPKVTFAVTASDPPSQLRVVSDGDVAMLLIAADGTKTCSAPSSDGVLPVPVIPGTYEVFLGTGHTEVGHQCLIARVPAALADRFTRRQAIEAAREALGIAPQDPKACGGVPLSPLWNTFPISELTKRGASFSEWGDKPEEVPSAIPVDADMPDPITLSAVAGGRTAASVVSFGCEGFIPLAPQHVLDVRSAQTLRLWVERPDVSLLVAAPDGTITCRAHRPGGAMLNLDVKRGRYEIYIGTSEGAPGPVYTLDIGWSVPCRDAADPMCRSHLPGIPCPSSKVYDRVPAYLHSVDDAVIAPIDSGEMASDASSDEILSSVVRVRAGSGLCTGTLVASPHGPGLLTAAHCVSVVTRRGTLAGLLRSAHIERVGHVSLDAVQITAGFRDCIKRRLSYRSCISGGAPDVAFVPLPALNERHAWPVCKEPPRSRNVTVFGFGLDHGRLPGHLLRATLSRGSSLGGLEIAGSDAAQWVSGGDSGGPVIAATTRYSQLIPEVCYVIAGSSVTSITGQVSSLLQPVWGVWDSLSAR